MVVDFMDCPHCRQRILEGSNFCRFCGKTVHNKLKNRFDCPECGVTIKNYVDFCENCGSKIAKDINYSIRQTKTKRCPNCNNMNESDANVCISCGKQLPIVSELRIINCPDCNNKVLDDVNYCRYCGHSFIGYKNETKKTIKSFTRMIKSTTNLLTGDNHCQNCGEAHGGSPIFCERCKTKMPPLNGAYLGNLNYEEYQVIFINQFIVPISKYYNENFREIRLKNYFNLTEEQEMHIIYVIMERIKRNNAIDVVKLFETTLKQTKEDFENLEEIILNNFKKEITYRFNSKGISSSSVFTVKNSRYDTFETPVVQNKHGGFTKGVATLGFGLIGLAATSGVKTTKETQKMFRNGEYIHYQITLNNRSIILKSYNDDSSLNSFSTSKGNLNQTVIQYTDVNSFNANSLSFILKSGEELKCPHFQIKPLVDRCILKFVETYDSSVNNDFIKQYSNKTYSKFNSILAELINEKIEHNKTKNNNQQQNVDISGLEKIVEMYEKGLLSDEEFVNLKQKIIGNETVNVIENNDIKEENYDNELEAQFNPNDEIEINYEEFTPAMIRKTFSDTNQMFIDEGKIAGVEEILDRAGVDYVMIEKNRLYGVNLKKEQ